MGNPIDDDDELAKWVGRVAGHFALAESHVELIFLTLLGTTWARSSAVFSFYKSTSTQRDAILRLAAVSRPEFVPRLKTTLQKYGALATRRNEFLHNPFGWDSAATPPTIYKMIRRHGHEKPFWRKPVTIEDAKTLVADIQALETELMLLGLDMAGITEQIMSGKPPPLPDTPSPPPPRRSLGLLNEPPRPPQDTDAEHPPQPESSED